MNIWNDWHYEYEKTEILFFFYLGFLSRTFTNHRTTGEGGGHFFNSSLPLPPASQTFRHQPGDYCRELTSAHSYQPDSSREPLVSWRKLLTTKLRALEFLDQTKLGQEIPGGNVTTKSEIFLVQSVASKDATYEVFFRDATSYPFRECFEWKKKLIPCKHMFAVIGHFH